MLELKLKMKIGNSNCGAAAPAAAGLYVARVQLPWAWPLARRGHALPGPIERTTLRAPARTCRAQYDSRETASCANGTECSE